MFLHVNLNSSVHCNYLESDHILHCFVMTLGYSGCTARTTPSMEQAHKSIGHLEFGGRCGSLSFSLEGCALLSIIIKTLFHCHRIVSFPLQPERLHAIFLLLCSTGNYLEFWR